MSDEFQVIGCLYILQVDFRIPTLILSECVLMYIASDATHKLLSYLSTSFADARYVNYDVVCDSVRGPVCDLAPEPVYDLARDSVYDLACDSVYDLACDSVYDLACDSVHGLGGSARL